MTFAPENSAQFLRSGRTANAVRPGPRRSRSTLFRADLCVLCRRFCCPRIARVNKQDAGRQHGPDALMSFWFGWGGVAPPMEGARLPLHAAHLFRLRKLPVARAQHVRAHQHGSNTRGPTSGGPTNERHTAMNPVDKLLKIDEDREATLRALGSAHTALDDAIATYRVAFKTATTIGWSKPDLTKAGFPDPVRLPKASTRTPDAEA